MDTSTPWAEKTKRMGFPGVPLVQVPVTGDSPERPVPRGLEAEGCAHRCGNVSLTEGSCLSGVMLGS